MSSEHTRKVYVAACAHGAEAIAESARAHDRDGADCLECLYDVQSRLMEWLGDVQAAIAVEIGKEPTASPTIERIRQAGREQLRTTLGEISKSGLLR